jgi:prepilin-type N-terminal cleavage/methylation domain-containing protein/prepilin-type processing-associated H-X9-DG protein
MPASGSSLSKRRPRRGFTMIELLVVLAIIITLMAILVPVLRAAWGAAQRLQCANRLKHIAASFREYHQLNGNTFPPLFSDEVPLEVYRDIEQRTGLKMAPLRPAEGWGKPGSHWSIILWPFLKSMEMYQCPADPDLDLRGTEILGTDGTRMAALVGAPPESYALNAMLFRCPDAIREKSGASWGTSGEVDFSGWVYTAGDARENVFGNLHDRVLVFCGASGATVGCQFNMPSRTKTPFPEFQRWEWHPTPADRPFEDARGKGTNYLYFGGHVEYSDEFPSRYAWGLDLE